MDALVDAEALGNQMSNSANAADGNDRLSDSRSLGNETSNYDEGDSNMDKLVISEAEPLKNIEADSDDGLSIIRSVPKKKLTKRRNLIDSDVESDSGSYSSFHLGRTDHDQEQDKGLKTTATLHEDFVDADEKKSPEKPTEKKSTRIVQRKSTWSDSNESDVDEPSSPLSQHSNSKRRTPSSVQDADDPKPWQGLVDSDDESDIVQVAGKTSHPPTGPKEKLVIPSDSDEEDCLPSLPDIDYEYQRLSTTALPASSKKSGAVKPKKLTHKQREELMKETLSKTQKMIREQPVSLPYEKPKALSLTEFLAKRAQAKAEFYNPELKQLRPPTPPPQTHEEKILGLTQFEQAQPAEKVQDWFSGISKESAPVPEKNQPVDELDDAFDKLDDLLMDDIDDLNLNEGKVPPPSQTEESSIQAELRTHKDQHEIDANEYEKLEATTSLPPVPSEVLAVDQILLETAAKVDDSDRSQIDSNSNQQIGQHSNLDTTSEMSYFESTSAVANQNATTDPVPADVENEIERNFKAQEAALEEYLEANKPKPPRKSLLEMLKMDPAYADVLSIKPKFEGSGIIDLSSSKRTFRNSSKTKGIESLKTRFLKHAAPIKKPKEQHHTVTVTSKEEDSQGNQKSTVNNVDYVERLSDNEDSGDPLNHSIISPIRHTPPGFKFSQFRERLQAKIRANKAKEFEEKLKNHSIYENEKTLEEKGPLDEADDILDDDDFSTESEPEETDEEAEALKEARRKKKKVKSAFVEEEADVSDSELNGDEDEDESDEDEEEAEAEGDDEMEEKQQVGRKPKKLRRVITVADSSDDEEIEVVTLDDEPCPLPEGQEATTHDFVVKEEPMITDGFVPQPYSSDLDLFVLESESPQITPAQRQFEKLLDDPILPPPPPVRVPLPPSVSQLDDLPSSDQWEFEQKKISGTPLSKFDSQAALDSFQVEMEGTPPVKPLPTEIAKLISNSATETQSEHRDSPEFICSGRFPSQQPQTPAESECFAFGSPTPCISSSPMDPVLLSSSGQDASTPKVEVEREKVKKTRLLFQELDKGGKNSEGNDEEGGVVSRMPKKRSRRLQFSDDEDEDEPEIAEGGEDEEDDADFERGYDSEENEVILPKAQPAPPPPAKGLISKSGKIRREFVDHEAELSGSEEGSGDEDERGLDQMDDEEGDFEDIDEEAVRHEIGKQHIRNLIDDDDRQIRFLQDVLLEDGDLHGDGELREKQFKWKHIDNVDFDMGLGDEEGGAAQADDEAERLWQEQKAEKTRWLKENSQTTLESSTQSEEEDSQKIFLQKSKHFKLGKSTLKKIQSSCSFTLSEVSSSSGQNSQSQLTTSFQLATDSISTTNRRSSFSINSQTQILYASPEDPIRKLTRGSFLARGPAGLTKIAEMTKGTESTNSIKVNSRNFVFSVITPPEPDAGKNKGKRKNFARHPATRHEKQPRKMARVDRSFENLDAATKAKSIFSQF